MPEKQFSKIRRSEFEKRENEFHKDVTRCAVQLRVPEQFQSLSEKCAPTHAEACDFEGVRVEDVNANTGRNVADEQDWKRLGCGVGRCTYEFKDGCVVKFARSGRRPTPENPNKVVGYGTFWGVTGEESNTYEVASYELADPSVKKFLTPIIAHAPARAKQGYKWLVQPLVATDKVLGYDRIANIVTEIKSGLRDANAVCEDIHHGNVGLLLDQYPVLIDYGFSVRCKRIPKGDAVSLAVKPQRVAQKGRKLAEFIDDKHKGRHGLKRPRGKDIPMGVLTRRRRLLWAEAGALRRKAKDPYRYPAPDRQKMLEDARFLEQQALGFQTKLLGKDWEPKSGSKFQKMLGLLNQTRKEAFLETH